jgi:hypothetical protein
MRGRTGRRILSDVSRILRFKEAAVRCGADPFLLFVSECGTPSVSQSGTIRVGSRSRRSSLPSKRKENETMIPEKGLALIQTILRRLNDGQSGSSKLLLDECSGSGRNWSVTLE